MQSDLFSCPVCYVQYDEDKHLPKVIPICGLTLCSACIIQILHKNKECPLDRTKFPNLSKKTDTFPVNYVVLQLIKEKLTTEYEICVKHDKPKKFVCKVDYMKICSECISSHTDHNIQAADNIQKEAQTQKKRLKSIIDEIKNHREEVESSLKASKKAVITVLTQEFDQIRDTIKEKEREILSKIESAYDAQKEHIGKTLEKDELLREKCELKIDDLETAMSKRFFRTLEKLEKEGIIPPARETEYDINIREEEYISAIETLGSLLNFRVQNTCFVIRDISNESDTNMIQIQSLENLFDLRIQDQHTLTVDPHDLSSEPLFLDYTLLKKIKILSLNCYGHSSQEHFNAMKRIYTFCDKVSDLRLYFEDVDYYEGDVWYFYSHPLWTTNNIESLTLDFDREYDDDPVIRLTTNALAKITGIKNLSISLTGTCITDQSISTLGCYFMKNALNLTKFSLELERTGITDSSIAELCKNMRQVLTSVKDFKLELSRTKISDRGLEILAEEGISLMDNLETFELCLCGTSITDQSIDALCANESNLLKTKKFILDIDETNITEDRIILLGEKIISKMQFIEDLTLELNDLQLTDKGVQSLSNSLGHISKNLKNLTLNLESNPITDTGFMYLAQQLLPELKGLKGLNLYIYETPITDKGISELWVGFQSVLKTAEIFFLGLGLSPTKVSGTGLKTILDTVDLESMPNLKSFDIDHYRTWDQEISEKLTEIREQLSLRKK